MQPAVRVLMLGLVMALSSPGAVAQTDDTVPAAPADGVKSEKEWRAAFRSARDGEASVVACRAKLSDYCSWEYYRSREESEVQAYHEYLAARRRGE